jgi:hypothetical protein
MRTRTVVAAVALALVGPVPLHPTSAGAAGGTPEQPNTKDTHCLAVFDLTFSPGISMSPSSGTATSHGETGTNRCDGPINGKQVTGPGTRGEDLRYGVRDSGTCSGGKSDVTFSFTMPTADGVERVVSTFVAEYGPLQGGGAYGGTFTGERMYGKFTVTAIEGDCVTKPITKVRLHCDEWVVNEK